MAELAAKFGLQLSFSGQMELVAAGEDAFFLIGTEGVANHGLVFIGAEDEPERGLVARGAAFPVVVVDVELELSEVSVGEFPDFEVEKNIALQHRMVENEVDIEVISVERDTFLP